MPFSEPSLEILCVRDAMRDMSLELCPGNVNEGACRQQRNSRILDSEQTKGKSTQKEREETLKSTPLSQETYTAQR